MSRLALVTGATGYVGGQLVPRLLSEGWRVRVLTRDADKLSTEPWADAVQPRGESAEPGQVESVEGDASDAGDVSRALAGVDVAWYLLHSMGEPGEDFTETEREMASTFAAAARDAGVGRIVYLGGLHPEGELSDHLASRVEVGEILIGSGVPTAALQAGVVIGNESASFIMLRHLSERLPGAVAPNWLKNKIQPIAVDDLMHYLVRAADLEPDQNRTFDIGGPEAVSYADMMKRYARAVGLLPRVVFTAPVTTPRLAARWIGLVTPISTGLAEPLVGSLLHDTVVSERDLDDLVGQPPGGLTGFDDAVRRAADGENGATWRRSAFTSIAAVTACAVLGSIATNPGSAWYRGLRKPRWQPPAAAFPIVWTALYAAIAGVSALVDADLREQGRGDEARAYRTALGVNLALNCGWSFLFFRARKLPLATLEATALAASSADLVRRAHKVDAEKGVVLAPYAAWTAFATALSATVAWLNRGRRAPRRK